MTALHHLLVVVAIFVDVAAAVVVDVVVAVVDVAAAVVVDVVVAVVDDVVVACGGESGLFVVLFACVFCTLFVAA